MVKVENGTFKRPVARLDTQEAVDLLLCLVDAAKKSNETIEIRANSYNSLTISCNVPFSILDGPDEISYIYIKGLCVTDSSYLEDMDFEIEEADLDNYTIFENVPNTYPFCLYKNDQYIKIEPKYLNILSLLKIDGLCNKIHYSIDRNIVYNNILFEFILKLVVEEKTREYVRYAGPLNYLNGKFTKK